MTRMVLKVKKNNVKVEQKESSYQIHYFKDVSDAYQVVVSK